MFSINNGYNPYKLDVWSMGILLYIFLFEEFPFNAESEIEIQMLILNKDIVIEKLPPDLHNLIMHLLEKDPEKRITVQEVLAHETFN